MFLALLHNSACQRIRRGITGVVATCRKLCHSHIRGSICDFSVIFEDGVLHGFIVDLTGIKNANRAGQFEVVSFIYVCGLHSQLWL